MDESEFIMRTDAALKRIESAMDACGANCDYSQTVEGVFEIEFDDGSKIIVNRHETTQEIWVATRSGGFHFRWDGKAWCDTKNNGELMAVLSDQVSSSMGKSIVLR